VPPSGGGGGVLRLFRPAPASTGQHRPARIWKAGRMMRWAGWLLIGAGYGAATSWLPAPSDGSFWMSNLSAPYLLLPFLAAAFVTFGGLGVRRWGSAMLLGVLLDWAMVAGFYARALYDPDVIANRPGSGSRRSPAASCCTGPSP
jgi:hypothetical protein